MHELCRLSQLPQVIYLDIAHEEHETLIELQLAWDILSPGGVLFGDDWNWDAVRDDVTKFAKTIPKVDEEMGKKWKAQATDGNVMLFGEQWLLYKTEKWRVNKAGSRQGGRYSSSSSSSSSSSGGGGGGGGSSSSSSSSSSRRR